MSDEDFRAGKDKAISIIHNRIPKKFRGKTAPDEIKVKFFDFIQGMKIGVATMLLDDEQPRESLEDFQRRHKLPHKVTEEHEGADDKREGTASDNPIR